jgi:hypothetical protein
VLGERVERLAQAVLRDRWSLMGGLVGGDATMK